jgi:hypothetical protein
MRRAQALHQHHIKYIFILIREVKSSVRVLKIATEELGIAPEIVPGRCHQYNGLIERLNRTIQEKIRTFLIASSMPDSLWSAAALYATHVHNLTPHSTLASHSCTSGSPHSLYMEEHADRLRRLYDQLVPFGIMCNVKDTHTHL